VRHVLLAGSPQTIEDLQGLVMDELEALQGRLRDGTFNSVLPFWDAERPHIENYCRDRLAEHLEPYLLRFGVRVHSEATMPDANRCDLLSTIRNTDLPIEIKGQWRSNLWDAACDQLEDNYARNYRSEGRGIYLCSGLVMCRDSIRQAPENMESLRMQVMLAAIYARSPKTSGACGPADAQQAPGRHRSSSRTQ
jgi:hypothetical protein